MAFDKQDQEIADILGMNKPKENEIPDEGFSTDVDGVKADDVVKRGSDEFPVFNVSQREFFTNAQKDRRRIRFESGGKVQKYLQGTKYNRDFYIKYRDENSGKEYIRKVR